MDGLSPSSTCDLGRKEYWNEFYSTELENFDEFGDIGDIWFGKRNLERILNWLQGKNISKEAKILDVGCGNGMTLVSLAKIGYQNLTGVDYSEEAILLAKKITEKINMKISYEVADFLESGMESITLFEVIIDKGTYDAICLHPENSKEMRGQYVKQIFNLLSTDGYFLLFSCNWIKNELLSHFKSLEFYEEIEIPSIGYGGKLGQTVTALIFKKPCT